MACADLRRAQASLLAPMPQGDLVEAISEWAAVWRDPRSEWRRTAEGLADPFPFAMTRVSLDALLVSLTPDALWSLIDAEDVRGEQGVPLVGHVIAGNTPLLVWVSVLRAMLMRSASFVKLPSGGAAEWGCLLVRSLAEAAPALAACVSLAQWSGGTTTLDAAICQGVDLLLAYGSPSTLVDLQHLCPSSTIFRGYGHRVSFGLVPSGAVYDTAADGLAGDVLLYDQGGCLSPQTVFVEAPWGGVLDFAECLAGALRSAAALRPRGARDPRAAARIQEARLLARMDAKTRVWEDQHLCWTVIARDDRTFAASPTHGIISVQPLDGRQGLTPALESYAGHLQGCAVADPQDAQTRSKWEKQLEDLGVSWICRPGELQAPPISWREDGQDVLRSLMPGQLH